MEILATLTPNQGNTFQFTGYRKQYLNLKPEKLITSPAANYFVQLTHIFSKTVTYSVQQNSNPHTAKP